MISSENQAIKFLQTFFSLATDAKEKEVTAAVRRWQKFVGIKADGEIGPITMRMMGRPRCGCEDTQMRGGRSALKKWPKRDWVSDPLLYRFEKFHPSLPKDDQRELFRIATDDWNQVCGIVAREAKAGEKEDVVVSTGRGRRDGFDGRGNTLAWAYIAGSLMRFDEDEIFTDGNGNGTPYRPTAAHEWGHIIGVRHSQDSTALMAPFLNPRVFRPQNDDIREAVARYGQPVVTVPNPGDPVVPTGFTGSLEYRDGRFLGPRV